MKPEKAQFNFPSYPINSPISAQLSRFTEKIVEKQLNIYRFFVRKATFASSLVEKTTVTLTIADVNTKIPINNWTKRKQDSYSVYFTH